MLDWIVTHWKDLTLIVTGAISVASVIVKLTPTPKDDMVLEKIIKVCEVLALTPTEKKTNTEPVPEKK